MIPPRECANRTRHWLLLVAAYGLVNASAKWQDQSDKLPHKFVLIPLAVILELYYMHKPCRLVPIVAKIVEDILIAGVDEVVDRLISDFNERFKLGTVLHGPGKLRFNGMKFNQDEKF